MQFTAQQIADLLQGQIEGDGTVVISKLAKIEEGEPGSICPCRGRLFACMHECCFYD